MESNRQSEERIRFAVEFAAEAADWTPERQETVVDRELYALRRCILSFLDKGSPQ